MKGKSFVVALVLVLSVLLSACGGGAAAGPAGAIQTYLSAVSNFDFKAAGDLSCAAQKDTMNQAFALFNSAGTGGDPSSLKSLFKFDFSGLKFAESSNDGKSAVVHMSGTMKVSAFGQDQSTDMNQDIPVVNEGGQWKVCGNPLSGQ